MGNGDEGEEDSGEEEEGEGEENGSSPPWDGMWYVFVGLKMLRTRLVDADVDTEHDEEAVDSDGGGRGRGWGFCRTEERDTDGKEDGVVDVAGEDGADEDEDEDEATEEMDERKRFILPFSGLFIGPRLPWEG